MCSCKCVWWMVLEWNVFEDVVYSMGYNLYSSQHQESLRLHVHGVGKVSCQGQLCNWHVRLPISCQGQHYS